jgi:hypothetical protein
MREKASQGDIMSIAQFATALDEINPSGRRDDNFRLFVEAAYCALAKRTAPSEARANELEMRYMAVVAHYGADKDAAMRRMSELFARLVLTVSAYRGDFLGRAYMSDELSLRSVRKGQFFTPYAIARLMVKMTVTKDSVDSSIARGEPHSVSDPCCGSGTFIIAYAEELRELGYEPERVMLATLVDVDQLCMEMTFLQMWIKGIPAICIHGNSLSLETFESACTAAAVLQRWPAKTEATDSRPSGSAEGESVQMEESLASGETLPLQSAPDTSTPARSSSAVFEQGELFG